MLRELIRVKCAHLVVHGAVEEHVVLKCAAIDGVLLIRAPSAIVHAIVGTVVHQGHVSIDDGVKFVAIYCRRSPHHKHLVTVCRSWQGITQPIPRNQLLLLVLLLCCHLVSHRRVAEQLGYLLGQDFFLSHHGHPRRFAVVWGLPQNVVRLVDVLFAELGRMVESDDVVHELVAAHERSAGLKLRLTTRRRTRTVLSFILVPGIGL